MVLLLSPARYKAPARSMVDVRKRPKAVVRYGETSHRPQQEVASYYKTSRSRYPSMLRTSLTPRTPGGIALLEPCQCLIAFGKPNANIVPLKVKTYRVDNVVLVELIGR